MSDSLGDILKNKKTQLPADASVVREYVRKKLQLDVRVESKPKTVTLYVTNSSMAAHLRTYLHIIARDCGVQNKRLVIRIEQSS